MLPWKELEFDKAFSDMTSKAHKIDQSQFLTSGNFPIIDQGQKFIAGFTVDKTLVWKRQLPVIIFGDHTRIVKFVDFPFVLGADGTKVLEINREIFPLFAYYQLLSHEIPSAGYSRHFKFLKEWIVRFPNYLEQQRIAAILQKADRLRRLRRYARQLSNGYLQSVFLEMFKGEREEFKKEILGDIAEIASGVTKGQNFKGRKTIEVPYLRVANVQDGYLNLTEIKTIQALPSEVINLHLKIGDILMTEGGDYDKLGRGTIWHGEIDPCIHQNHIFRVRLDNKKLIPEFFDTYLLTRCVKNYFLAASKKTTNLATINMTQIKKLPVIMPPMKEQERFAAIYRRNEHFRNQQSESMRQAEHLFQSLLQRAFQGEL